MLSRSHHPRHILRRISGVAANWLLSLLPKGPRLVRCRSGRLFIDVSESPMMLKRALWSYEPRTFKVLKHFLRPGMTFVDCGANRGDFAVYAAQRVRPGGRVVAVEPAPDNVEGLRRSLAANELSGAVTVVDQALSDRVGSATLHLCKWSGGHSIHVDHSTGASVTVRTVPLDSIVDHADLIKIDVEGGEEALLRGATRLLRSVSVIVMDVHPHLGVSPIRIADMLISAGLSPVAGHQLARPAAVTAATTSIIAVRAEPR